MKNSKEIIKRLVKKANRGSAVVYGNVKKGNYTFETIMDNSAAQGNESAIIIVQNRAYASISAFNRYIVSIKQARFTNTFNYALNNLYMPFTIKRNNNGSTTIQLIYDGTNTFGIYWAARNNVILNSVVTFSVEGIIKLTEILPEFYSEVLEICKKLPLRVSTDIVKYYNDTLQGCYSILVLFLEDAGCPYVTTPITERENGILVTNRISVANARSVAGYNLQNIQKLKIQTVPYLKTAQLPDTRPSISPLNLFNENTYSIKIGSGNDTDVAYNVKVSPSLNGAKEVRVPTADAAVAMVKTSEEDFYIVAATDYESVNIKIDASLDTLIKDRRIDVKSDRVLFELFKSGGFNILFNEFSTIENNLIQFSSDAFLFNMNNNSISIDSKENKIAIGIVGDGELTTPFDNYIQTFSKIYNESSIFINYFLDAIKEEYNNFSYSICTGGVLRKALTSDLLGIFLNFENSIVLNTLYLENFYQNFDKIIESLINIRSVLRTNYDTSNIGESINLNVAINEINNLFAVCGNDILAELLINLLPLKSFAANRILRGIESLGIYWRFSNKLLNEGYVDEFAAIEKYLLIPTVYETDGNRKIKLNINGNTKLINIGATHVDTPDATFISILFFGLKYILSKNIMRTLTAERENYLKDKTSTLSESLGMLLKDMCNFVIGGLNSYQLVNNVLVLQPVAALSAFDSNMNVALNRIENLLK